MNQVFIVEYGQRMEYTLSKGVYLKRKDALKELRKLSRLHCKTKNVKKENEWKHGYKDEGLSVDFTDNFVIVINSEKVIQAKRGKKK